MSRNWFLSFAVSTILHGGAAAVFLVSSPAPAPTTAAAATEHSVQVELVAAPQLSPRSGIRQVVSPASTPFRSSPDLPRRSDSAATPARADQAVAATSGGGAAAADPGAMSDYYQVLQAHLSRYHVYPAALMARPTGTVRLGLIVQRDGRVMDAWVENSSGVASLDEAALQALRRAQPLPVLPKTLPGAVDLIVPFRYEAGLRAAL